MSKKITPDDFKKAAKEHLKGTNLFFLLSKVQLKTNGNGFIEEFVVENLKTTLKVASKMTPSPEVKDKCRGMLEFLEKD